MTASPLVSAVPRKTGDSSRCLRIDHLRYRYPKAPFRLELNFAVPIPVKLAILGPNGSGKTTLLKLLGGHFKPQSGSIFWDGTDLTRMSPGMRPTSTVFQDHALFPHYTVRQNIEFPLWQNNAQNKGQNRRTAEEWMERLELTEKADCLPSELSLGFQQRVAIARSLAMKPQLLLLDEPSAALDVPQRQALILLLNKVFAESWIQGMVFVTHDLDLAFSVANTIAVIDSGNLVALDQSAKLHRYPSSIWLAEYLDSHNIIRGKLIPGHRFEFDGNQIQLPSIAEYEISGSSRNATMLLHPSAVRLGSTVGPNDFQLNAVVEAHLFHGPFCEILSSVGDLRIRSFIDQKVNLPKAGEDVVLNVDFTSGIIILQ